jgi:hypothetical protein
MARPVLTDEEVRRQVAAAQRRARRGPAAGPRATGVRYDAPAERVVVEFGNGCEVAFPVALVPGTGGATRADLEAVELHADGEAIAWEALDAGADVRGLLLAAFDVRSWAAAYLGASRSPAKAEAARRNGRRGGRPRREAGADERG